MNIEINTSAGTVRVALTKARPTHADELRLVARCALIGDDTVIDSEPQYRSLMLSGLATGQISLEPAFWRPWRTMEPPNEATNPVIPENLTPGETVTVGEEVWHGGVGAPSGQPNIGEWYADLSNGNCYKGCRGELSKFAEDAAKSYVARRQAYQAVNQLDLPEEADDSAP